MVLKIRINKGKCCRGRDVFHIIPRSPHILHCIFICILIKRKHSECVGSMQHAHTHKWQSSSHSCKEFRSIEKLLFQFSHNRFIKLMININFSDGSLKVIIADHRQKRSMEICWTFKWVYLQSAYNRDSSTHLLFECKSILSFTQLQSFCYNNCGVHIKWILLGFFVSKFYWLQ